ncbi:hypothetical protein MC7420_7338 [Coleofasciculus chthonoplastes PCC 7420]|uniref:Sulfotransferase domain superfamily n=1 Tax=Coleofasciculus chthonoplastes PCC 7420 TaxID=118168 RepID=B4VH93_9CYAN|nr:sulfotransferase [Coleofasciculus chthonoplastes]EDX78685.1 hypothetical protein MC7420_7338 [Coleofasciculus chthonoplastes PCC 7420]
MYSKKPILVTGSHRSGSSWVGKILATSPSVRHIREPFNINHPQCSCGCKFNFWYQYISPENEAIFYDHLKHTFGLAYNFRGDIKIENNPNSFLELLTKSSKFMLRNIIGIRPLVKDPMAFFSARWLAATFNMHVVVLIRHPAAFVSSLKRLNWVFPYSHFLEQPLLMKDYLQPFADEIAKYCEEEYDIIDQASLLWRIIHYYIDEYQKNYPDWIFIRHEDISRHPLILFQKLFNALNLDYTEAIEKTILDYSRVNDRKQDYEAGELKRHSQKNIELWKSRLTPSEIERVRTQVEDISIKFYCSEDW